MIARLNSRSCMLVLILLLSQSAEACRYTVRDVAMVDLADPHYQVCLVSKGELSRSLADSLTAAAYVLTDSNVKFRLLDSSQEPADAVETTVLSALETLGITSYPAVVMLAPDGRVLKLTSTNSELVTSDNSIDTDLLRKLLRSVISSPPREELLHYLLRGHSVILVVEGTNDADNRRAISWGEAAIDRVDNALPTMAKPIELPPRMIRFSLSEAQREKILLWSLGVDLDQTSVTQIALLFGRGRKLGPVLKIPGSRQQDLWRSLEVVGNDCECGLDRSWMQGPMIPHDWSTSDEADAVAALGFDPGNPLVKAEISRILARGPLDPKQSKQSKQSLQEPLPPQLQLGEIDIDAIVSAQQEVPSEQASAASTVPSDQQLDLVAAKKPTAIQDAATKSKQVNSPTGSRSEASRISDSSPGQDDSFEEGSTAQGTLTWILAALILVAGLGSLGIILISRKKQA